MTKQSGAAVDKLLALHGAATEHVAGACFTTEQVVCKSNAGFYVGTWCIEVMDCLDHKQWLPQPNSRDSGYMTEQQAKELLASWQD